MAARIFKKKVLPETISFLDEEALFSATPERIYKLFKDKSFSRQITELALKTAAEFTYVDEREDCSGRFNVTLGGSMEVLHPYIGTCSSPECRTKEATNIARTVGIFADKIFISDHLTGYLSDYRFREGPPQHIQMMLNVLNAFAPLINNDVVDLRDPRVIRCRECFDKIENKVSQFASGIIDYDANVEITVIKNTKNKYVVYFESEEFKRLGMTAGFHSILTKKELISYQINPNNTTTLFKLRDSEKMIKSVIDSVKLPLINVIDGAESAAKTKSTFVAKSCLDTMLLSSIDDVIITREDIENFEKMRQIQLPWVGELSIQQILKLREEAFESLHSLREVLSSGVTAQRDVNEVVKELALQVPEIRRELEKNAIVKRGQERFAKKFGILAVALVVYGLASQVPAAGVGGIAAFLAAISHLRNTEKEIEEKEATTITSPAYALLKAKDLLYCNGL